MGISGIDPARAGNEKTEFKIPRFYVPPRGGPLYWRNEQSGVLPDAIWAFINFQADRTNPEPTERQLKICRAYLDYYIFAPCWDFPDNAFAEELSALREKVKNLQTPDDISQWIFKCLELGIDPL